MAARDDAAATDTGELPADLHDTVAAALREDLGSGDRSSVGIPRGRTAQATVLTRQDAVLCGRAWFDACFTQLDAEMHIDWLYRDGETIETDTVVCRMEGKVYALLSGERTALNFLQLLSGTATFTRACVKAAGDVPVLDTRKTLPGLRSAQKYAVTCGGGHNHRMGLFDAVLLKENHLGAAGGLHRALAPLDCPVAEVQVEVENQAQLEQALAAGIGSILLDNFTPAQLAAAVKLTAGRARLEASGNIEPASLAAIAASGVDAVSIGALTKHVRAIDFSLRLLPS